MNNRPNLAAILYFAAIGLALGAGIGWLALNSWLGIGFLVVGVILLIGLWAELDFLTDIATAVIEPMPRQWSPPSMIGMRPACSSA